MFGKFVAEYSGIPASLLFCGESLTHILFNSCSMFAWKRPLICLCYSYLLSSLAAFQISAHKQLNHFIFCYRQRTSAKFLNQKKIKVHFGSRSGAVLQFHLWPEGGRFSSPIEHV